MHDIELFITGKSRNKKNRPSEVGDTPTKKEEKNEENTEEGNSKEEGNSQEENKMEGEEVKPTNGDVENGNIDNGDVENGEKPEDAPKPNMNRRPSIVDDCKVNPIL